MTNFPDKINTFQSNSNNENNSWKWFTFKQSQCSNEINERTEKFPKFVIIFYSPYSAYISGVM